MSTTLHGRLTELSGALGDRPAVTQDGRTVSFAELDAAADSVAHALIVSGVRRGDRIAVIDKNSIHHFELMFGAARAGVVTSGLNFRLSAREIAQIIEDAKPGLVFVSPEFAHLVEGLDVCVIVLDESYDEWRENGQADATALPEIDADDVVLQLYSSGTTGVPKGAMLTHRNLSFTPRMGREFYDMDEYSVNLLTSPLFHIGGAGYSLTVFGQGGHNILAREFVVNHILSTIEQYKVTNMFLVPSMIDMLMDGAATGDYDLSSLRRIAYGGAPITTHQLLRAVDAFGCDFMAVYGMTEAAGSVCSLAPEDHDAGGPRAYLLGSVGKSLPWHRIAIFDPETGREAAPGVVGEICINSDQTMAGYWNHPDATVEAIDVAGWFHTGDAGLFDEDGYLYVKDRIKDMVISGGENIYPIEVEGVLIQHPAVKAVAVIGVPHEKWGETVKAVVVTEVGATIDPQELIEFCRERLARYKCPTLVETVADFPRNASGKVLKRVMREQHIDAQQLLGAVE